jgi:hypothetical protein
MTIKTKSALQLIAMIWGIIFTLFILFAVVPKIVMTAMEDPSKLWAELGESFTTWFDPMAFSISYLFGYILIWWKPLWGAILIILVSIFYVVMGGFGGPPIFAVPGLMVGVLYLLSWYEKDKKKKGKENLDFIRRSLKKNPFMGLIGNGISNFQ